MRNWKRIPKDDPYYVPEVSEEYFEVQALKTAVWQYIVDHARVVTDEGLLKFILFYMPSEQEFWRRVKARKDGVYKRTDLLVFREREERLHKKIHELRVVKNRYKGLMYHNKKWEKAIKHLEENGTLWQRIKLRIAKEMRVMARKITEKMVVVDKSGIDIS